MKKTTVCILVVLASFGMLQVFAQQVKKKKPTSTPAPAVTTKTNEEVIEEVDTVGLGLKYHTSGVDSLMYFITDTSTTTRYFMFPQFYSYWPITKLDTIIKYQCYDVENSYINIDTLQNIDDVWHIHFVKVYNNLLHTYIDQDGRPRPSAATKIIYRYDKTNSNTWKSYDVANKYVAELLEDRNDIVRRDTTTLINPITKGKRLTIRKYYRVTEQKKDNEIETDK